MHISIYSKHCGNFRCSCLCNSRARDLRRVQERAGGHRVPRGEQPRRGPVQVDLQQLRRAHQVSGHQHTAYCIPIGGSQQNNAGHNIWRKRLY